MLTKLRYFLLKTIALLACGAATSGSHAVELREASINIDSLDRSYLIQLPASSPRTSTPLLVMLHGHGGSASQLMGLEGRTAPFRPWLSIAEESGAVLVALDGVVGPDGRQGWNDLRAVAGNPTTDDMAFVRAVVDRAVAKRGVDPNQVYLVGISNGGHMALRVALEAPELVAGIGVVAAAMPQSYRGRAPHKAVSVAFMNGTKDRLMPYKGGSMARGRGEVLSTANSFAYWVDANGCAKEPKTKRYQNTTRKDRSRVIRTLHARCKTGAQVALFEVRGAGHSTPSLSERYRRGYLLLTGRQNWDIESAREIWSVLKPG